MSDKYVTVKILSLFLYLVTKPKNVKKQSVFDRLGQDPSEQVATSDKLKTGVQPGSNKKEVKALKPLKTSTAYEGQVCSNYERTTIRRTHIAKSTDYIK